MKEKRNNCLEVRIGWQEANDSEKGWGKTWHIKKLCKQNRKKSFRKIKKLLIIHIECDKTTLQMKHLKQNAT